MPVLQQRFAPERELRERAHQGGRVVGVVGDERNLTRTRVRLKGSRPEVTKSSHMAAAPVVWWCVPMSAPARPGARVRMRRPGVMGPHPSICTTERRRPWSLRPQALSERGEPRYTGRQSLECLERRGCSAVSRTDHGLVENALAHTKRQARAWRLTTDGEAVIDAHRPLKLAQRRTSKGGSLVAPKSGRRGKSEIAVPRAETVNAGFRMTALTYEVLAAVASLSGRGSNPNNRDIAAVAGVKDEGQISKLLARLERHGMLVNTGGHPAAGNAWRLTLDGEEILSASRPVAPGAAR